ncbi:MAG: hypothetical protein IJ104_00815 [Methanobrevibacter sp.]|nr:hypothetical protein [Methanobrevibacter sp.]MBQ9024911.1 hypothetical protein [Methanobrevibacter sp.]
MAWEEIEPEEETGYTKYPKFEKVGDFVEGNLYEFETDGYGNKRMVLEVGEDEDGEPLYSYLPSHAHLQRFYKKVAIGDFLRVELVKLIEPDEDDDNQYPVRKYKVQVDPDRSVRYEEEDEDDFFDE